jgi:hypothetical protein
VAFFLGTCSTWGSLLPAAIRILSAKSKPKTYNNCLFVSFYAFAQQYFSHIGSFNKITAYITEILLGKGVK